MPSRPRPTRSRTPRLITLAAVLLTLTTWSFWAFGGGVSFSTQPIRVDSARTATPTAGTGTAPTGGGVTVYGINRQDCLGLNNGNPADPRWQFRITNPGISYQYLEVWARTDSNVGCSDPAARGITGLAPVCAKVATFSNLEVSGSQLFEIPDVAMMAAITSSPHRKNDFKASGFAEDKASRNTVCNPGGSQDPINLYLSFLLTSDLGGTLAGGGTAYELIYATTYDLAGPDGPVISTGAGNTLIKIQWNNGTSVPPPNLLGYKAYCVELGAVSGDAGTESGADAGTIDTGPGVDTTPGVDSSGVDTADADPDADTAIADTTPATDSATTTDAGIDTGTDAVPTGPVSAPDGCGAGAMLPAGMIMGQLPTAELEAKYRCPGDAVGPAATNIVVTGLKNNVHYAVAVAGLDTYSNPGTISNIVCETPRETIDFYDAFTDAGGTAGGGYCSYSPIGSFSGLGALGLALLGLTVRLVRRRRRGSAR